MSDSSNPLDWVSYAEEDLVMAKSALKRIKPLTTASCFHSQQCAEKYLKALLIAQNIEFPKTHDLPTLNTLCDGAGIFTGFTKR
jgi:HEPN domain-containing protein